MHPFETNFTKAQAANENLAESSRDVYSAIASLQRELQQGHPSLPSDINKAANNYGVDVRLGYPRVMDETDRYIYNAFKAGAKWMAEQGETLESLIWRDEDDKLFIEAFVDENKFKMADNVTIQIRKK